MTVESSVSPRVYDLNTAVLEAIQVSGSHGGAVDAGVSPRRLPHSHPLAAIGGATNAVTFETDYLGQVTVSGPGAGRVETGFALLSDIAAIHRRAAG